MSSAHLTRFETKLSYPIDVDKKIKDHLKSTFKKHYDSSRDKAAAERYNELRTIALGKTVAPSEHFIGLLANYYDQTKMLLEKIVIAPGKGNCDIKYTWHNVHDQRADKVVKHSGAFDALGALYNLAALKSSYAGVLYAGGDEEGKKSAMTNFSAAATYFHYLANRIEQLIKMSGEAITDDLKPEVLRTNSAICLAQAAEMLYLSEKVQGLGDATKAGLAQNTSELYAEAKRLADAQPWKLLPMQTKNIVWIFEGKCQLYAAYAECNQAAAIAAGLEDHGQAIRRCQNAAAKIPEAKKHLGKFTEFKERMALLEETIKNNQAQYTKDNDWLYHSPIPAAEDVAAVAAKALVKIANFDEETRVSSPPSEDLFGSYVIFCTK